MGIRRIRRRERGAAAVELAFLAPLLVLLAFGTIQFGIAYNRSQGMNAAVREGARLGSDGASTVAQIEQYVEQTLQNNDAGAGFPAPGAVSLAADIEVDVIELDSALAQVAAIADGDVACDGTHHAIKVVARITNARRGDYGVVIPLLPSFPMSFERYATFRCLS